MKDSYGRLLSYLRVSVTDRCNLRCVYCMPKGGVQSIPHDEVLSFDEITRLVRIMAGMGVSRVRFTGGEPLVRRDIDKLIKETKQIEGIEFIGLTTNGVLLAPMAKHLRDAGVDGVNISIDTLDAARYVEITRCDELHSALEGLNAALCAGFASVRINCVLWPKSKPKDWLGVVELAKTLPVDVRLIEWMPMRGEKGQQGLHMDDVLSILQQEFGQLKAINTKSNVGPAQYWQAEGFLGQIGIIHGMSHNFCADCNRIRLTAAGDLKLCLFYDRVVQLKQLLRGDTTDEEIKSAIANAVLYKPKQHMGRVVADDAAGMYKIGG